MSSSRTARTLSKLQKDEGDSTGLVTVGCEAHQSPSGSRAAMQVTGGITLRFLRLPLVWAG